MQLLYMGIVFLQDSMPYHTRIPVPAVEYIS